MLKREGKSVHPRRTPEKLLKDIEPPPPALNLLKVQAEWAKTSTKYY